MSEEEDRECEECGCKLMMNGECAYCDEGPLVGKELDNDLNLDGPRDIDPSVLAGTGLEVPTTPKWIQEKRMDTFSRAISTYREEVNEIDYAKWCVNEFDKFFETGLAKEEDVQEPEVSEAKYTVVVEKEGKPLSDGGLYAYAGFVCVTEVSGKQTIVNDLPVLGEGVDKMIAMINFNTHGREIIEQLKIEGRFE